jgi:surfactin synthase thioesterase subunit
VLLFCFPHAGGGASSYRTWPEIVADRLVPLPVELPGRESRYDEPPIRNATEAAAAFIAAVAPFLTEPFALFGHSMGALIAYEAARLLQQQSGQPEPLHVFVSAARAPHLADPQPPLRDLPSRELIDTMRRWNGVPEMVLQHPELLSIVLPILRADLTLCETYSCATATQLAIPITAFGGRADPKIVPEEVEGWTALTTATCTTHFFDAGHFYIDSHRLEILDTITAQLAGSGRAIQPREKLPGRRAQAR